MTALDGSHLRSQTSASRSQSKRVSSATKQSSTYPLTVTKRSTYTLKHTHRGSRCAVAKRSHEGTPKRRRSLNPGRGFRGKRHRRQRRNLLEQSRSTPDSRPCPSWDRGVPLRYDILILGDLVQGCLLRFYILMGAHQFVASERGGVPKCFKGPTERRQ
jgi:hypothetical protein